MTGHETAERRQVTIVHIDIVNSTALVDNLDPEEVMGMMRAFLDSCRAIVSEFHGTVAGYTGDGFEAYFGYPVATEEFAADALNASVRFGEMLAERDQELSFDCRIGVATGGVVVDRPGIHGVGRNILAFGATPTLAARLQQTAKPGRILTDDATMKLCEGRFAFQSMGATHLKGFEENCDVWEVIKPLHPAKRLVVGGLSPYVGRTAELQLLNSRWQSALAGEGQVVLLHGEPGIGKSRLVYEFRKSLSGGSGTAFQYQCLSQFTSTPLHPWIHSIQRFANIQQNESFQDKQAKLQRYLGERLGFPESIVEICATLMGLAAKDTAHKLEHASQHMARLQSALTDHLIAYAQSTPLFLLVEDIQWIDASTMALLQSLAGAISAERVLLAMTCRSGDVPTFNYPHVTSLSLTKLDNGSVLDLIARLSTRNLHALSDAAADGIRRKSDGNPLFVEELTKHWLNLATPHNDGSSFAGNDNLVPQALQGSLMGRIDNAGQCKEVAQLASVIGRDFDRDIVVDLLESDRDAAQQQLDELTALRILKRIRHGKNVTYEFCHALLRDAVYSSILKSARIRMHARVAEYLEYSKGAVQNSPTEVIAFHYECCGDKEGAFRNWLAAGQHALRSGATEEASNLLSKAVNSSSSIARTPEVLRDMAAMYLSHGFALNAWSGVGANPIASFRKAEELSEKAGLTETTLEALDWQFGLHFNAGELLSSKIPAERMKVLGSRLNHPTATAAGCQGVGMAHFMLGEFHQAREELERGIEAGRGCVSGEHCFPSMSLSYLAWALFVLGYSDEAASAADRAIESARHESSHALATALSNCSYVYQCMTRTQKIYTCMEELKEHTKKHGELMYFRRGTIIRGWADCQAGADAGSLQFIADEIDFLLRSKEEIETTFLLGVLAELQIKYFQFGAAHSTLDRALDIATKNQEFFYLSEIYRLKAKLAAIDPTQFAPADGSDYLSLARKTALRQHAKAWLDRLPESITNAS